MRPMSKQAQRPAVRGRPFKKGFDSRCHRLTTEERRRGGQAARRRLQAAWQDNLFSWAARLNTDD